MPLQPKKLDNAKGASKLYNLPGFLDSDKTMQLLLVAIVLYSSLPTLPQQNKTKNKKNKTKKNNKTMQLLLRAIVLYSSLPSLPQQKNKTKNKKQKTKKKHNKTKSTPTQLKQN